MPRLKLLHILPIIVRSGTTCLIGHHSKRRPKLVFKTDYRLIQVKSIAECSKRNILQYFRPSLSYHLHIKTFVLSSFEWPFKIGFTVFIKANKVCAVCQDKLCFNPTTFEQISYRFN